LERLIDYNSIQFADDKRYEEWMVGYYLRHSYCRLIEINKNDKKYINAILIDEYFGHLLRNHPQFCWRKLHEFSEEVFNKQFKPTH